MSTFIVQHAFFYALELFTGERPSICPFLKNNGDEALKGPSPILFSGMDKYKDFLLFKIHLNKGTLNINRQTILASYT